MLPLFAQWWRYTRLLDESLDSVDAFISPSTFTSDVHRQRGFRREIHRLPLFFPQPQAAQADDGFPRSRPYFLFVGRLEKIKGLQEIIPVFRDLPEIDLLVAGTGSYEPQLREIAEGAANIEFLGWVPQHRLATLYRNATALVVPSICYEVFGTTVVEAFAHGTPVVVSALGGLPELVEESEGGFIYHNRRELIAALDSLLHDSNLRQRMGANGYRTFIAKWSEEAHLEAYFDLLARISRSKHGFVPWEEPSAVPAAPAK